MYLRDNHTCGYTFTPSTKRELYNCMTLINSHGSYIYTCASYIAGS